MFKSMPKTFWIAALIAFVNALSFTILIPNLYPFALSFGLNDFQASLLFTIFGLAQFVATPIIGRLSDKFGRKPLLAASLFGTFLANILSALAPFAGVLFFARFLDGITGGNMSVAQAIISDTTSGKDRAKGFGIFMGSFSLGFVVGPSLSILAAKIPTFWGITPIGMSFVLSGVFALIATIITLVFLPETNQNINPKAQLKLADLGFSKLLTAFRMPKVGLVFNVNFLSGLSFTIFTFSFQPFFIKVLGQNEQTLALVFTMVGLIGVISQFYLKKIIATFRILPSLFYALILRALAFLLIPLLPNFQAYLVIMFFFAMINSIPQSVILAILSKVSDPKKQGEIMGINSSYLSISNSIGPMIGGILVGISYEAPFFAASILTVFTALVAFWMKSRLPELDQE
jgi:predicted MFS family arabinose efflux permease